jgi:hypothetical protein
MNSPRLLGFFHDNKRIIMKKPNHLQNQLKFHCAVCQTAYQLLEIQQGDNSKCADDCLTKWQELLVKHYHEKLLFYFSQQELDQAEEKEVDLAEKLGLKIKDKKK